MPAKVGERKKKKRNKKKTGGFFKRGGPNTNDPTPKMASHWLQGETSSVSKNAMVNEKLSYAPAAVAGTTKKQRGFGARIKGMVKGRTKRKGDDDASNSIYSHGGGDYDPHNPPPNRTSHYQARPAHGLDPRLLPQVVEEDDQAMMERLDSSAKRLDYSPERPHEHEMSFAHESFAHDSYVHRQEGEDPTRQAHFEDQQRPQVPAQRRLLFAAAEEEEDGSKGDPISLVLLLVDPETLRFELLQLEFDNPQEILIKDVLQQILTSVTEPAINRLQFHALVDRLGKQHDSKSKLLSACAQRIHNKDLLVGLSKGVTLEHCSRLCRPILGDEKVIGMVRAPARAWSIRWLVW